MTSYKQEEGTSQLYCSFKLYKSKGRLGHIAASSHTKVWDVSVTLQLQATSYAKMNCRGSSLSAEKL